MPAAICHNIHGHHVIEKIKDTYNISINQEAFDWGTQGPDFLFCHRFLPWMKGKNYRELGTIVHNTDPNILLSEMKTVCDEMTDTTIKSYFYGFLCHYSYDSIAHQYINFKSEALKKYFPFETNSSLHNEIESALDSIILRNKTGALPGDTNLKIYFPLNIKLFNLLSSFWYKVISNLELSDISEQMLLQSMFDANKIFSLLTDKYGLKKELFSKFEKGKPHSISSHIRPLLENPDLDAANIENNEWIDIYGETRTDNFFTLIEIAEQKAYKLINGFINNQITDENIKEFTKSEPFG